MLNLAFDTATSWGRFALAEGSKLLAYRPVNVTGSYADALLPVIDALFKEAHRELAELGAVGVTRGPGSFTGVRIGVATAKGLAYGCGVPLVSVTTLEAMAADLLAAEPDGALAVPVLDARRRELFAGLYRRRGAWVEPVLKPAVLSADAWWERLRSALPNFETPVWGGDGLALLVGQGKMLRPELRSDLRPDLLPNQRPDSRKRGIPGLRRWSAAHPATARALALAMGDRAVSLPHVHPFTLKPLYLRASDAEVKRHLDLTPQTPASDIRIHSDGGLESDRERP